MAPVYMALGSWEAGEIPGAAVFSLVTLLIITITLLALCSRCQKHSFDLQQNVPEDRNSALVRVVQLDNGAVSVDNPAADVITTDEKYREPRRMINGDRHDLINHDPRTDPAASESPATETNPRPVHQTASTRTDNVLPPNTPEPGFHTIPLDDEANHDSPKPPHNTTQHTYETAEEIKRPGASASAEPSKIVLNPYATYESIKMNSPQGNGSHMPAPPAMAEELDEDHCGRTNDTYAKVSKKNIFYSPPVEPTLAFEPEEDVPPLL